MVCMNHERIRRTETLLDEHSCKLSFGDVVVTSELGYRIVSDEGQSVLVRSPEGTSIPMQPCEGPDDDHEHFDCLSKMFVRSGASKTYVMTMYNDTVSNQKVFVHGPAYKEDGNSLPVYSRTDLGTGKISIGSPPIPSDRGHQMSDDALVYVDGRVVSNTVSSNL